MEVTITMSTRDVELLKHIAKMQHKDPKEVAETVLHNWIETKIREFFQSKFDNKTIDQLIYIFGRIT